MILRVPLGKITWSLLSGALLCFHSRVGVGSPCGKRAGLRFNILKFKILCDHKDLSKDKNSKCNNSYLIKTVQPETLVFPDFIIRWNVRDNGHDIHIKVPRHTGFSGRVRHVTRVLSLVFWEDCFKEQSVTWGGQGLWVWLIIVVLFANISSLIILRQHYYESVNYYDALIFSRIVFNLFVKSKVTFSSLYSRCIASLVVDF